MRIATLISLLIGIWIGLVLGLSFVEAPLKFTAPGITTELGVGIGRIVFEFSNKLQLAFLGILILSLFSSGINLKNFGIVLLSLVTGIMLVQNFYLLPVLGERVAQILEGHKISSSHHHLYFVATEVVKILVLIILFIKLQNNERH